jgi:hypothetical protein
VQLVSASLTPGPGANKRVRSSSLRATTDAKAAFAFEFLEPGAYTLEITPPRDRARGRRGVWYRERIVVRAGRFDDRRIQVPTGDLRIRILNDLSGMPVRSARIELVPAADAANRAPKEWRRLASARRASARDGVALIRDLMPQRYVYTVSGSGLASALIPVSIGAGETSVLVRVAPKTSKKSKSKGRKRPGTKAKGAGKRRR